MGKGRLVLGGLIGAALLCALGPLIASGFRYVSRRLTGPEPSTRSAGDLSLAAPVGVPSAAASRTFGSGALKVTVSCKVTGGKKTFLCDVPEDCPADGAEVFCRDAWSTFYGGTSSDSLDNWLGNGVWERKKDTWALLDEQAIYSTQQLEVDGILREGQTLYDGDADAMLYHPKGSSENEEIQRAEASLVRFAHYEQVDGRDRLALEVGALFDEQAASAQKAAWEMHLRLTRGTAFSAAATDPNDQQAYDLWEDTAALEPNDRKALLLILGTTASELAASERERVQKRSEGERAALKAAPFARLQRVARDWTGAFESRLNADGWALPPAKACPAKSDNTQVWRHKEEEAVARGGPTKEELRAGFLKEARAVDLEVVAARSGKLQRVPVLLTAKHSFALSGSPRRTTVPDCWLRCCDDFGNCDDVYDKCYGDEFRVCGKDGWKWTGEGISATLQLDAPRDVSKGSSLRGATGKAIVVVNKSFRACDYSSAMDDLWGGELLGYEVRIDGYSVHHVVNRDVSVDEALAGPDAFDPARRSGRTKR